MVSINIKKLLHLIKKSNKFIKMSSLKTRIIFLILSATVPIIISTMVNFYYNNHYMSEYFTIHEQLLSIDMILDNTDKILPIVRNYISNPVQKDFLDEFNYYKDDIDKIINNMDDHSKIPDEYFDLFLNDINLYIDMCDNILKAADNKDPAVRNGYNKISYQADNLKRSAINLTMHELNYGNSIRQDINENIWNIYTLSIVFAITWISLMLIFISTVLKRVVSNLKTLEELSLKVTQGQFDVTVDTFKSNDEIGLLASAFNKMILSLKYAQEEIETRQNELHKLNVSLTKTNNQLMKSNEDLKNAQEQIIESEKLASLGSLVAGVSHEINTPIGVSVSAASFLNDKNKYLLEKIKSNTLTKKEFEEYSGTINETSNILLSNLKRASELMGSFKMIAVDQTSESLREINLYNYIEDIILNLKHVLKKKSVEVFLECEDKSLIINTYPGILAQLLTNLVMNSVIHGFEDTKSGLINIKTYKENGSLSLEYSDNGKGIDKSTIKKIYDPFYTTKRGQGGSGLGMFIVYNIVTKHFGGSIECNSNIGEGVTFYIKIPLINN